MMLDKKRILVLGVGNLLMGDDGIGVHVIRKLEHMQFPQNVRIEDGGMGGVTLIEMWENADHVILIDAADMGKPPGTCVPFAPEEVRSVKKQERFSLHHTNLFELMELMDKIGMKRPSFCVIGVQPETVAWTDKLTKTLQEKIPEIIRMVIDEVNKVLLGNSRCTK